MFVHYYPKHGWADVDHDKEVHYSIPPHWNQDPPAERTFPRLEMVGTAMREPDCEHEWCRLQDSIQWSGPGEEGYWIDPNQQKHPFHPQIVDWNEEL